MTERGKSISGSHHFMNVFRKVEFQNNRERGWREERGGWASCCFVAHSRMSSENGEYAYHVGVVLQLQVRGVLVTVSCLLNAAV